MKQPLNILVIEDNTDDFRLVMHHLERQGLSVRGQCVGEASALASALEQEWDLVLADYHVPGLGFREVLQQFSAQHPDVPFILITGHLAIQDALELLKQGVWDFVLKDQLAPLVHLLERNLREAAQRRVRLVHEREIERLSRLYATLGQINQCIAGVTSREALCQQVCHITNKSGGFKVAWIARFDVEGNELSPCGWAGDAPGLAEKIQQARKDEHQAPLLCDRVLRDGRAHVVNHLSTLPEMARWETIMTQAGVHAAAVLPISVHGKIWGIFGVYAGEKDVFQDKEVELLTEAALDIGHALQNLDARAKLHQSEEQFRAMFELASIGIAQADPVTGRWLRVNPKFCAITRYAEDELLQIGLLDVTHPEDRDRSRETFSRVIRGEISDYRIEKRYVCKDGTVTWVNANMSLMRDAAGQPVYVLAAIEDISERKRLEAQYRQAQKLEAIGQLAGGVAHDFNNLLAAIMMNLDLFQMIPDLDDNSRQILKDLNAAAYRGANLARQLLMFSRQSVLAVKPLDLNEVVENFLKMLRRLIGEQIDLQFHCRNGIPRVEADVGMLEQVLMNLVVNARDAMPRGGRITISTHPAEFDADNVKAHPSRRAGRFVCLSVADTGCGMDHTTLKHIFEPFFTTKEPGRGTGLGLATVDGILAQHQGWAEVESEKGQGTTFRVYLPAITQTAEPEKDHPQTDSIPKGTETILLVEDEMRVRHAVAAALLGMGYTVHQAGNAEEALDAWKTVAPSVDLLLTDMVMPGEMTGLELAERFQASKPGLKVIIASGYSAEIVHAGVPTKQGIAYLPKPFNAKTLAHVLRQCLDHAAALK